MTATLDRILIAIAVAAAAADIAWVSAGHFDIDAPAYALLALLAAALAAGSWLYSHVRKDERLAAMLAGTGFLIAMSAAFSVLNTLLLTVAGHRIDAELAAMDRRLGVDWPAMMALMVHYPWTNAFLQLVYISVLPQIAVLLVALGLWGRPQTIYALCLAVGAGAAICIGIWTVAPSFGAFSVYELPPAVAKHLALALDGNYARSLVSMLAHGPGRISPADAKGLIGFPSYHAVLALLVVWYARQLKFIRWIALALNAVVLVATPIQGGHHVVDVLAGFAVAALAVLFARAMLRVAARSRPIFQVESEPIAA